MPVGLGSRSAHKLSIPTKLTNVSQAFINSTVLPLDVS